MTPEAAMLDTLKELIDADPVLVMELVSDALRRKGQLAVAGAVLIEASKVQAS